MAERRHCTGLTKKGTPCQAAPMKDHDYCLPHAPKEIQVAAGFGGVQPGSGRPPRKRVVDVIKERLEDEIDLWWQVLVDARHASKAVIIKDAEGNEDVRMVADHQTRLAAFREVHDRAYGKPRQAVEHSGPDGEALQVAVPTNPERAQEVTVILVETGAIQNGHGDGNGYVLPDIDG